MKKLMNFGKNSLALIVFIGICVLLSFFVAPLNYTGYKIWSSFDYPVETKLSKVLIYFCGIACVAILVLIFNVRRLALPSLLVLIAILPLLLRHLLGIELAFPLDTGFVIPIYYEFWIVFFVAFVFAHYFFKFEVHEEPKAMQEQDFFQSDAFAGSVAQAILEKIGSRKVYAITGKWGAGKTYAMEKVFSILQSKENRKKCYSEIISNYAYTSLDEFLAETLAVLSNELEYKDLSAFLHAMPSQFEFSKFSISSFGRVQLALDRLGGIKNFKVKTEAHSLSKPVVLIYDDIDRLNKAQLSILYQGLHLVSQIRGVSVLLCQNNGQIDMLLGDSSSKLDSFQEKYIDERFEVPEPSLFEYQKYFNHRLDLTLIRHEIQDFKLTNCIRATHSFLSPRRINRIVSRFARIKEIAGVNILDSEVLIISFLYEMNADLTQHILSNVRKYRRSYYKVINGLRILTTSHQIREVPSGDESEVVIHPLDAKIKNNRLTKKYGEEFERMQLRLWSLLLEGDGKREGDFLSIRNDERTDVYSRLLTPTISFDAGLFAEIWTDFKSNRDISLAQSNSITVLGILSRISYFTQPEIRSDFALLVDFVARVHDSAVSDVNVEIFSRSFEASTHFANWLKNDPGIWSSVDVGEVISKLLLDSSRVVQLFAARVVGEINRGNYSDRSDIQEYLPGLNDVYDAFLRRTFETSSMDAFLFSCLSLSTEIKVNPKNEGGGGGIHSLRPIARCIIIQSEKAIGVFETWKYCIRPDGQALYSNELAILYFGSKENAKNCFIDNLEPGKKHFAKLFCSEHGEVLDMTDPANRDLVDFLTAWRSGEGE